jgi:hypothetical protein
MATERMASSGMLRRVTLVRTDVSEELSASIRVTGIFELGTTLAVTSNRPNFKSYNMATVLQAKRSGVRFSMSLSFLA